MSFRHSFPTIVWLWRAFTGRVAGRIYLVIVLVPLVGSAVVRTYSYFQVELSCFWRWNGCRHVVQIAPQLWQYKNAIETATLARLQSNGPCPNRILAWRVRYLPGAGVLLLESTGPKAESIVQGNRHVEGIATNYRLVETLRGGFSKDLESVWDSDRIAFPGDYNRRLAKTGLRRAGAGTKVLAFSDLSFDSCGIVPATPASLSAVEKCGTSAQA